jgi:hypothetical protein
MRADLITPQCPRPGGVGPAATGRTIPPGASGSAARCHQRASTATGPIARCAGCSGRRFARGVRRHACRRWRGTSGTAGPTALQLIQSATATGSKRSRLPHFTYGMRRSATSRRTCLTETPRFSAMVAMSTRHGTHRLPEGGSGPTVRLAVGELPEMRAALVMSQLLGRSVPSPSNRNRGDRRVRRFASTKHRPSSTSEPSGRHRRSRVSAGGQSAPAARPCVAGAGSRRPEGRREILSLGTYRELRWHAMHRREPSGDGRARASAMVLAMALGLARARASRRLEFLPTLSRQTSRESRTTGPRADNRSARLPQLIAVSGRRAGVIGLKRRRVSQHAVPCGRADSDLTPIGRRHGGQAHDRCGAGRFGTRSGERESARAHGSRCAPTGTWVAGCSQPISGIMGRSAGTTSPEVLG